MAEAFFGLILRLPWNGLVPLLRDRKRNAISLARPAIILTVCFLVANISAVFIFTSLREEYHFDTAASVTFERDGTRRLENE
jgi:hypothetical protein